MTQRLFDIEEMIESLKQQRDEMRVQIHLAKAEVRDEFAELEQKIEALKTKADNIRHEAGEVSDDVFEATKRVGAEIKSGIQRIRKLM